MNAPAAVVLLSGGLDSTTTLAIALSEGFTAFCMSFRYGQRHEVEIEAARKIAEHHGAAEHRIVDIDLAAFGGSALTDEAIPVPRSRSAARPSTPASIPPTYVPARNTIFLSYALAWAEVIGSTDIFIGVNAVDYSGYPDCRPGYIDAFETMARLATRAGVEDERRMHVHAPLIHSSKAEIIRRGLELGVEFGWTTSCYDPPDAGTACGECDACVLRLRGFEEAGLEDPVRYAEDGS